MEQFLQDFQALTWQEIAAGIAITLGFVLFVPAIKALSDALSKAIYALVSSKITEASASIGMTGLELKLRSLEELEGDRSDPEYLDKIEMRLQEIQKALNETEGARGEVAHMDVDFTWRNVLDTARSRLLSETDRLQARSQANLLFGATTSLIGIVLLVFLLFVFPPSLASSDWKEMLIIYGPRVGLVVIVELISTFFFRLYVSNENDIKLNKNEITNVEMRLTAVLIAEKNRSSLTRIAELFANEERNFILKKGERAVGESAHDAASAFAEKLLPAIVKKTGGAAK